MNETLLASLRAQQTTLRIVVTLYAFGLLSVMESAGESADFPLRTFLLERTGSERFAWAFLQFGTTASAISCFTLALIAGLAGTQAPKTRAVLLHVSLLAALLATIWQAAISISAAFAEGAFQIWMIGQDAGMLILPIALARSIQISSDSASAEQTLQQVSRWLAYAAAIVFFCYGWKVIFHPVTVDSLLTRSISRWNGYQLVDSVTRTLMWGFAFLEWGLALLAIWGPRRLAMLGIAMWGMIAALSRISANGLFVWDEALLRAVVSGIAIASLWGIPQKPEGNIQ
ncbi:hypothetical protein [Roseimaritima multifibrata]|uniref:hypothetical protein n=1 Tax=Roseimaritima multifibrata TaxID=1930274 RepID=UPI0011A5457C|nr:hypothetical protein [Roseimaritima multifibrata]